ncbi:MAG: metallophosphoesterase [Clostridia bacterium]|nr:metallophosphoesterase [Clostridia bacterium]
MNKSMHWFTRGLAWLLALVLAMGLMGCLPEGGPVDGTTAFSTASTTEEKTTTDGITTEEPPHEHLFERVQVTHTPCILAGEQVATCACGEVMTSTLPATGVHVYENGVCLGCGQNEIPLTAVSSVYDADGDGQNDVYYFSPLLTNRLDHAIHVSAGDYDPTLSSAKVSTTTAGEGGIRHWYVAYGANEYIVYRVNVPEDGLYEMVIHFRMKDAQLRGAKYTVNGGTDQEQIFETSHSFEGTGYEQVRDSATLTSYMYGITVNLKKGENIIRIDQPSVGDKTQHFRDFYFVKVGETHFHSYENAIVALAATCVDDGVERAVCACGRNRVAVLPATGEHTYVNDVCSVCNRVYRENGILYYDFLYDLPGFAGGTVEFCPEVTDTYTFYWGDANGKLKDYTMLYSETFEKDVTAELTVQSFTAIPKGATHLLAVSSGGSHNYAYEIPAARRFGATELYSFGALSDSHQGTRYGSNTIPYNHFVEASRTLYEKGVLAIGLCGDFSYDNIESEYILHADAVKEIFGFAPQMPIFTTTGNHESKYTGFSGDWYLKYARDVIDHYDSDLKKIFFPGDDLDYVVELPDGSVMVYLHQVYYDYNKTTSRLLDDYQLDWLGARLEQYKDRTVFLFFHTFLDGEAGDAQTSTGKEYGLPLIAGTVDHTRLTQYLTQYKNVVYFSGHSHQSFDLQFMKPKAGDKSNLYTNIDNNNGTFATMVHIPSVAATRSGTGLSDAKNRSEGYIVYVYEDCIVFEGYDFVNDQAFAYATYIIQK